MHTAPESEQMIEIQVGGDASRRYPRGVPVLKVLEDSGAPARGDLIAARFNGALIDLERPLEEDGELEGVSVQSDEGLEILRHSTSHVMACAVQELFPEVKVIVRDDISDPRNYRVSFGKIRERLGFECRTLLEQGIRQIEAMLSEKGITDYREAAYNNYTMLSGSRDP